VARNPQPNNSSKVRMSERCENTADRGNWSFPWYRPMPFILVAEPINNWTNIMGIGVVSNYCEIGTGGAFRGLT
ncbi:MAG: hypothetical protein ACRER5_04680, partial [Pseudomonas sp.]